MNTLFVCTANVSRSPYAERRLRMLLGAGGLSGELFAVSSAGIPGTEGRPMDPAMVRELERCGGDGSGHLSRPVSQELLLDADLVLTMEFAQHMRILEAWPWARERVLGLRQCARTIEALGPTGSAPITPAELLDAAPRDSMGWDVADPYRRGRRAARRCAEEIDELLTAIVPALRR